MSLFLPRLLKLPSQCYVNGLSNVGILSSNKEMKLETLVICDLSGAL